MWEDTHLISLLLVRRHVHLRALACTYVHLRALVCTFHIKRMNGSDTSFPFFFFFLFVHLGILFTYNILMGMIHTFQFFPLSFIYLSFFIHFK